MTERVIRVDIEARASGASAVTLDGLELATGRGAVVCAAARRLIERGHPPPSRLEAWRGTTFCLGGKLATFAALSVREDRGMAFVRWTLPPLAEDHAPARAIAGGRSWTKPSYPALHDAIERHQPVPADAAAHEHEAA